MRDCDCELDSTKNMSHCELEEITRHINDRISAIRQVLELRVIAKDEDKRVILRKVGRDVLAIDGLLDQFENLVGRQRDQLKYLKDLEEFFQEDVQDVGHLRDNTPTHMPRRGQTALTGSGAASSHNGPAEVQPVAQQPRKSQKHHIREMEFITAPEYESIPQYMKGRITYEQLNGVVCSLNQAVQGKYRILHQGARTLSSSSRALRQRFKDQENKDTKGQFFVVEADIVEFTQTKVDKRFQGMMNMLRHCQRLRELRGGRITRYVLL